MTHSTSNPLSAKALLPEKPLLLHPSLATAIGVEEALFVVGLRDRVAYTTAHQSRGFAWYQLRTADVCAVFPFWNKQALQRISTSVRDKGVLVFTAPITETADNFRFAFNEKVQQQLTLKTPLKGSTLEHAPSTLNTSDAPKLRTNNFEPHESHAPGTLTVRTNNVEPPQPSAYNGHFLSKQSIAPNWQPDQVTIDQLAQHGITQEFALQRVPEFITYWHERGDKHHSWGAKFIQSTLRQWRDFETQQHKKSQESTIAQNWQPSLDAMEILTLQAGINRQFVEDAVPEFVLYWQERGETHRTWNTKFIQHIRIQWAKYTNAIEHNTDPHPIPPQWQPSEDVFDVLRLANIDVNYAKSLIPEFVLYWRDRGLLYGSWNTKYLQHVKHLWAKRLPETQADGTINRPLREISLEEELTDRSWAQ